MADRRVALITGTSRGIGNRLARHFLALGYHVVGCSRSEYAGIDDPNYRHEAVDVASEAQVVEMVRRIRVGHGRLDVAVNNAVRGDTPARVAMTSSTAVSDALLTNVVGPFTVCREATRLMMRHRSGRIVNIGSMATAHPIEGGAVYTAAKAAVNALTVVHAREVAAYGITCNVVAPAAVKTDLLESLAPETVRATLSRTVLREPDDGEGVAQLVGWLAGPEAAAVTGQIIYLGGA